MNLISIGLRCSTILIKMLGVKLTTITLLTVLILISSLFSTLNSMFIFNIIENNNVNAGYIEPYSVRPKMWLVQANLSGDIVWNKRSGAEADGIPVILVQTIDGGFALAGQTPPGMGKMWLVKTDTTGNILWSKSFGGSRDEANSLIQTLDGGFVIAGFTRSFGAGEMDMWLVKTNATGYMLWSKTYGGKLWDNANALVQTTDGGFALAGYTNSFGIDSYDMWLVKTDATGKMIWNTTYGGQSSDQANALVQTVDGGFAIAGQTISFGAGSGDMWLVKIDTTGKMMWNTTYGGKSIDRANKLVQTADGGFALAGYTNSFGAGSDDMWLVKTDATGKMMWNTTYGGENNDQASALVQTNDGGFTLAGYTNSFGAENDLTVTENDVDGDIYRRTQSNEGPPIPAQLIEGYEIILFFPLIVFFIYSYYKRRKRKQRNADEAKNDLLYPEINRK